MPNRFYRRRWNETRGDELDDWGRSLWYFEVDDDGWPVRQIDADGRPHNESLGRAGLPTAQRADPPLSGVPGHVVVIGDSRHAARLLVDRLEIVR
ncbi:hypothetical protein FXF52_38795 [Micromonospora sp. MP36]|nr:hypothetical protein FXF52_38795 [Micromonospora sp. MP36]